MIRTLALLACLCVVGISAFGTLQSAGVKGTLMCNGKPAANVKVKLYDEDTTDLDDLLQEGLTDEDGKFELSGKETEVNFRITQRVHTCLH